MALQCLKRYLQGVCETVGCAVAGIMIVLEEETRRTTYGLKSSPLQKRADTLNIPSSSGDSEMLRLSSQAQSAQSLSLRILYSSLLPQLLIS